MKCKASVNSTAKLNVWSLKSELPNKKSDRKKLEKGNYMKYWIGADGATVSKTVKHLELRMFSNYHFNNGNSQS